MRRKVDFPAPDRPMMPTKAGPSMEKLTLSTAAFWPNIRVTDRTSSIDHPLEAEGVLETGCDSRFAR